MLTRILAATVAGGIAFFILGFLIFGLLLGPNMMQQYISPDAAKLMNETPVWAPLIIGNLVLALLLAYIFERWATISTFVGGLIGGAIIVFLLDTYFQMMFLAFMKMHTSYIPVIGDIIGSTVMGALAGGVIGAVLGMMKKAPARE
jgi:hypothetical protein